jgi:hypothetical protein
MARPKVLDAAQVERAQIALNSGCAYEDVAARFGVSKMTLIRSGLRVRHFKSSKKKKAGRIQLYSMGPSRPRETHSPGGDGMNDANDFLTVVIDGTVRACRESGLNPTPGAVALVLTNIFNTYSDSDVRSETFMDIFLVVRARMALLDADYGSVN